jgi:hypothetical protein
VSTPPAETATVRTGPVIAALVVGVGLILAPVLFQMFSRAPSGESMIDDFRPYMTVEQIELFQGYMAEIGEAVDEVDGDLRSDLVVSGAVDEATFDGDFPQTSALVAEWPVIDADMSDMLATMDDNRGNYAAVDALPPFGLFPWFFVIPGLLVAFVAALILIRARHGRSVRLARLVLVGLGVAVALAPVAFQMFSRAPDGGVMINDFRSLMTTERVQNVQGYFVTLGTGEGELRTVVVPLADDPAAYPAVAQFNEDWPRITGDFAPMIGTMSNNLDNFADVDALPAFPLFPWFFVVPGVLIAVLAFVARPTAHGVDESDNPRSST